MKKSTKISLLVGGIAVVLIGVIGITYAFFSTGGTQETANTFTSGCLNISLTDASASISLSNIYPVTDIEGLDTTSYDFTITNTCNTDANYEINLESLNQVANSLSADYIKVSLSSDTVGNVISILSDKSVTPEIDNAYEAYNLYTGTLKASETKTYHLKLWLDYDATVEQAANKVYQSKINVVANPEIQVVDNLEATFELNDKTLTSNLTSNVTSATYCTTTSNICTPSTSASISNNSYTVELQENENKQMVCTRLNGTSKVICSNSLDIAKTTIATDLIESLYPDNQDILAYDDYGNLRYIGADPNNYVLFNDELWRIIGVFSEDTHGASGQKLIKIIRNDSIGNISWDSGNVNDWSTASLQTTLNGDYLNGSGSYASTGIKSDTARNMIETVTWKLGGTASYTSSSNGLASHFYGYERGTTVYSGRPTTWSGKVALMYPSDYGYATSGGSTTNRDACLAKELYNWDSSSFSDCKNNDWLYDSSTYQWTLTPLSSVSIRVFYVYNPGYVYINDALYSYGVRPSVYLTSNVKILGGDGTSNSPYTLEV